MSEEFNNNYENNFNSNNVNNTDGFNQGNSQQTDYSQYTTDNTSNSSASQNDGSYHFTGSQIPSDETYMGGSANSSQNNQNVYSNSYNSQGSSYYGQNNTQGNYGSNSYGSVNYGMPYTSEYGTSQTNPQAASAPHKKVKQKAPKVKKEKKPVGRGALAVILVVCILCSGALGFGGGYAATKMFGGGITVNQTTGGTSSSSGTATATRESTGGLSTTEIVSKTADSVVEITTETVSTGSFFQQYVSQGAGSGVIISEDGYILTNNHVIDGANTIKVTLRDATEYDASLIGADSQLDVALLKIEATNLTAATFGDSSAISVGDYAVAIGNPLGRLGGTVTDGIISALDRDVIIDGETMCLMQTNAAINPGNSGGGLFNANGELIGIICAKASSSSTEVEGLGFAIPINKVLDILNDLKQYGYVQGRIDLGMTLTNVTSTTGYQPGVYVSSVTQGSNAQSAGFQSGDLITKVNGTEVTTVSDVNKIIENLKVGDNVKFSVTRGTKSGELTLTLEEYNPNKNSLTGNGNNQQSSNGGSSIWDYFNW